MNKRTQLSVPDNLPIKLDQAFWELIDTLVKKKVLTPSDREVIEESYEA